MKRTILRPAALFLFFSMVLLFTPTEPLWAGEPKSGQTENGLKFEDFNQSMAALLETENITLSELAAEVKRLGESKAILATEQGAYRLQLSTYANLLVVPGSGIDLLEKSRNQCRESMALIQNRIRELSHRMENIRQLRAQLIEQETLNDQHLSKVAGAKTSEPAAKALTASIEKLAKLLVVKKLQMDKLLAGLEEEFKERSQVLEALSALNDRLERHLNARKRQERFRRSGAPLSAVSRAALQGEWQQLKDNVRQLSTGRHWLDQASGAWEMGGFLLITFCLLFSAALAALCRVRRHCRLAALRLASAGYPWRLTALTLLQHSLPLFGATLFLDIALRVRHISGPPALRMVLTILWTFLLTGWARECIRITAEAERFRHFEGALRRLEQCLIFIRLWVVTSCLLSFSMDGTAVFTQMLLRMTLEAGLLLFGVLFVTALRGIPAPAEKTTVSRISSHTATLVNLIIAVGPVAELAGYGAFARYWYIAWGRSLVMIMWAAVLLMTLREWERTPGVAGDERAPQADGMQAAPVFRWLVFQLGWLLWALALLLLLLYAWGASHALIAGILKALRYPISFGQITLSPMGLLYTLLALFLTHLTVQTWQSLLLSRVLIRSGMETGLQESISTISGYCIWGIGILVALNVLGLNTASLAVALGALGIGIGLGLQNIVNNFVSGIILMFERPIQVGDDVEIGGTWATVKKINVRATVVQTYDNASLIIPNSEFISSQVTNWSFKDKRLRRKITVGVAYGSDLDLVCAILREIADSEPSVLPFPHPDVLFSDFGDSALVFTLRIWTTIDGMLTAETKVRLAIDRRFREEGITIAFPQCDVHLFGNGAGSPVPHPPLEGGKKG